MCRQVTSSPPRAASCPLGAHSLEAPNGRDPGARGRWWSSRTGKKVPMRIGVLTGGGDCPGLNAVIRALVRRAEREYDHELIGFRHGWRGVIEDETRPLTVATPRGLIHRGGTILGTSRTNPYKREGGEEAVFRTLERRAVDALVAIGGEDTLGVAQRFGDRGVHVVGVPK